MPKTEPVRLAGRARLGSGTILPPEFYSHENSEVVARGLLGKVICTALEGGYTSAVILETEAYKGTGDAACHSHGGRRTERTEIMYGPGGRTYVYLCYGLHHLFNIITGPDGQADGVLIRAAEPLEGEEIMAARRKKAIGDPVMLRGPGALSQALGITKAYYGASMQGPDIWLEDRGIVLTDAEIKTGPRIGVDYAGADALHPWRYWVAGSHYVSGKRS